MSSIDASTDPSVAVSVRGVTQRFSLRHEKTLKGVLVNLVKGHPSSESFLALDNVNLEISAGSTTGLIGHNGSGKSTLLKIIGGVLTPTHGQVVRRGQLAALLELGAGFHRDLSGRENVYLNAEILGLPRKAIDRRFDEIVEFSGVEQFIDTPMKYYSSGMFVRMGFSVAIHTDPDILLVDEVLAVGDEQFKAKCLDVIRRMQNEGRTIVLVTHSMDQVTQFCDQAALLHHGQLRAQGSPADVISAFRKLTAEDANGAHVRVDAATPVKTEKKEEPQPQVLRVTCRTGSGSTLDSVHTGETLEINAEFSGAGSDAYVARIGVYSGSQLIFETSTDRLGLPPFEPGQPATCRFVLRELPLAGGRYRIAVSTAPDRYAAVLHTLPAAVQFSVSFSSDSAGPMAVEASAESVAGI